MSSVLGSLRRAREWAYPQLTESAFLEKGVLTPEEFVRAGDELVFRCPTWEWSSSSSSKKQKAYLPPDKQYLITRNVPCRNRVSSLETNLKMEGVSVGVGEDGDGDGEEWMISSVLAQGEEGTNGDDNNIEDEFDILDEDGEVVEKVPEEKEKTVVGGNDNKNNNNNNHDTINDDDDEYGDMDDYEDDDILIDDDAAALPRAAAANSDSSAIVKTRTYDLSITYDKYYQVPRIWMVGRDENDQPLTSNQMMEDVISDYANKTVTMETHPHVSSSCPHASIHPCQHAKVMKAIVKNLMKGSSSSSNKSSSNDNDNDNTEEQQQLDGDETQTPTAPSGPSVENYLFIFLKFVSCMIPTINYDFTMEVTADTSK